MGRKNSFLLLWRGRASPCLPASVCLPAGRSVRLSPSCLEDFCRGLALDSFNQLLVGLPRFCREHFAQTASLLACLSACQLFSQTFWQLLSRLFVEWLPRILFCSSFSLSGQTPRKLSPGARAAPAIKFQRQMRCKGSLSKLGVFSHSIKVLGQAEVCFCSTPCFPERDSELFGPGFRRWRKYGQRAGKATR